MDKPYDLFGKYEASELLQLPNLSAILLQQDIHAKLENASVHQEFHKSPLLVSPQSMASATGSSNRRGYLTNRDDYYVFTDYVNRFHEINYNKLFTLTSING